MACVHSGRTSRHVARCDRVSHRVSACGESAERRRSQTAPTARGESAERRLPQTRRHKSARSRTTHRRNGHPSPRAKGPRSLSPSHRLGYLPQADPVPKGRHTPRRIHANLAAPGAEIPIRETQHCPPFYATLRLRLRSFPSDRRSFPWNSTERSRAIDASLPIRSLNIATQVLPVFHDSRVSCSSGTRTFRISLLNFGAIFGAVALFC